MSDQSRKRPTLETEEVDISNGPRSEEIIPSANNDNKDNHHNNERSAAANNNTARQHKRKKRKQEEREQQQAELTQRQTSSLAAMRSVYQLPKRLLILDLNKVLLYRTKGSDRFVPRPHAVRFLQDMAQRFVLAVWTSMKRNSGHRVLSELFDRNRIPLLFVWFQTRCVAEYREEKQQQVVENTGDVITAEKAEERITEEVDHSDDDEVPGAAAAETIEAATEQANNSSNPPEQRRPSFWVRVREKKRQRKLQNLGLGGTGEDNGESAQIAREKVRIDYTQKPIFHKPLQNVWRDYPYFGEHNTILLDDTEEKCVTNNEFNCVHPTPFELNITQLEFDVVYSRPDCRQLLPTNDAELAPQGKLWMHLDAIAQYEGSLKEFSETHGLYQRSSSNEQQDALTAQTA